MRVHSTFANGVATGSSRVEVPGVGNFTGVMDAGRLVSGEVTMTNGDYYRGGLSNWRFHGTGLLVRANDQRYAGAFHNGVPQGMGVSFDPATRTMIEGEFSGGQPNGRALVMIDGPPDVMDFERGRDVSAANVASRISVLTRAPGDRETAAGMVAAERGAEARALAERRSRSCLTSRSCYCLISATGLRGATSCEP